MAFKNTFGSQGQQMDLQRQDLFKFHVNLPASLGLDWTDTVEFSVEKFPFPERSIEMISVRYMQQTNFLIGGDTPTPAVEVPCRFAFAQPVAEALERWYTMTRNPVTGGVGLTSLVKTDGMFYWLVPDQTAQQADLATISEPVNAQSAMQTGLAYYLEGILLKGFKFSDADMTTSGKVDCQISIQIDRYYPLGTTAGTMIKKVFST